MGASTISQQTAKNVFSVAPAFLASKRSGSLFHFSYRTCLEQEKNHGGLPERDRVRQRDLRGRRASELYYGKTAAALGRSESAMLAAIIPDPLRWDPRFPTSYMNSRQQWILWNMENIGKLEY